MAKWQVYSSRNGNLYSNTYSAGSYLQEDEFLLVDNNANVYEDLSTSSYDNYNTDMSDKVDAASNAGYFETDLSSAESNARLNIALNSLQKAEELINQKVILGGAIGVDQQGNLKNPTDAIQSYFDLRAEDEPSPADALKGGSSPLSPAIPGAGVTSDDSPTFVDNPYTGRTYRRKTWTPPDENIKYGYKVYTDNGEMSFDTQEGADAWKVYTKGLGGTPDSGEDKPLYDPKSEPSLKPKIKVPPSSVPKGTPGFASKGWSTIYRGFLDQQGIGSPDAYQYMAEKGLSQIPELRTAETQFLLQHKYDTIPDDTTIGSGRANLGTVNQNLLTGTGTVNQNPYQEFLQSYNPLKGKDLIRAIDTITESIKYQAIPNEDKDLSNPINYDTNIDINKQSDTYLGDDKDRAVWTARFGARNEEAAQAQRQLVALPILENNSSSMRREIVSVLNSLYNAWETNPNTPASESWLEYARNKDYWGMVPSNQLQAGTYGAQTFGNVLTEGY
jgi:hypothetical protein